MEPTSKKEKRGREEDAVEDNRKQTLSRSRQWETVDSNDEDSEASADSDKHKKNKKEKKEKKEKKKKNDKKHKKEKKEKKTRHSSETSDKRAVDQNEYGKYGVIREEHFFQRQREFEAYMAEVKGMPGILLESKRLIMMHFKSYIEDFNTATMPHDKYYNYDHWEMAEYQRKQQEAQRQSALKSTHIDLENQKYVHDDEEAHRLELRRLREEAELAEFNALKRKMSQDSVLTEKMRHQETLRTQLQLAYKQGDEKTVKRLEKILAPDEVKVSIKHPWAG